MQSNSTVASSPWAAIQQRTQSLWSEDVGSDAFFEFGRKYENDPVGFLFDCILWDAEKNERPTSYQIEIAEMLPEKKRVCVRSLHGSGKTACTAQLILWFALTRDAMGYDWKIPTTASAWRQLVKFLWPEIHKWARKLNWQKIGRTEFKQKEELFTRNLRLSYGEAFALASNRSDLLEGAHADHMLYIFDESKLIPETTWDSVEGAFTKANAMWLAVSTPAKPEGRFYHIQARRPGFEDWWVRHIGLQEAVDAGRVSFEWANARREQWGESSASYQNRVLGEFAQDEADSLIPLHWVEKAISRWYAWKREATFGGRPDQIGVDVARMGEDKTVLALRYKNVVDTLQKYGKITTMEGAGYVAPYVRAGVPAIMIDVIGVGAGVYDRLMEQFPDNEQVVPFHPQEATDSTDKSELYLFHDTYSAAWWHLRELLDLENETGICLPPDDELVADLTAPMWNVVSSGKIRVEPKEKVKDRLGRSPDAGDAVVMSFWEPVQYGAQWA